MAGVARMLGLVRPSRMTRRRHLALTLTMPLRLSIRAVASDLDTSASQAAKLLWRKAFSPFVLAARLRQEPTKLNHVRRGDVLEVNPDIFGAEAGDGADLFNDLLDRARLDLDGPARPDQAMHEHMRVRVWLAPFSIVATARIASSAAARDGSCRTTWP